MSTFVLMELCKQSGVKNVIYQLLAPSITLNLDEVEENRSYAVIIDKGIRYCLTGNSGIYDEEASYVLLTDRTPTKQKLIDNEIKQRKWIKHPNQIEASPNDVINSWENRFHFKLEKNEAHPGLRRPQLGALYALLSHMLAPTETAIVVGLMQQLTPEEKRIVVMFLTEMGDESKQDVVDRVRKKYGVAESEDTRWFREHAQTANEWDGKQAWGQQTEQQRAEAVRLHLTEEDMDERTVAIIEKHLR